MSVFKIMDTDRLQHAKNHAYFLDHSPQDTTCPFRMAQKAEKMLKDAGAKVKFSTYSGGHGWHGDVYGRIRRGIRWLEQNAAKAELTPAEDPNTPGPDQNLSSDIGFIFKDGFEDASAWREGQQIKGVRYLRDTKRFSEGQCSLCISKREKNYFPIAQWSRRISELPKGTDLDISVDIKALRAHKAVVDIQYLNAGSFQHEWAIYIGAEQASDPPAHHDWKTYTGIIRLPEDADSVSLALQVYGPGSVWFDNLIIREHK
jgi:hypothetical protein